MGFFDLFRRAEHVAGLDQLMEFLDAQAAILSSRPLNADIWMEGRHSWNMILRLSASTASSGLWTFRSPMPIVM